MIFSEDKIQEFSRLIENASSIVLIPHQNSDGDAIGSILGWVNVLRNRGIKVDIVVPDEVPPNLMWMKGADEMIIFENDEDKATQALRNSGLLFFMDFNSVDRTGKMAETLQKLNTPRVLIDHHPHPAPDVARILFSDTSVSSTCELSYHLIVNELEWPDDLGREAAECFYSGIITDTGSLSYNSSHPRTYYAVADLVGRGIDKEKIHKKLFQSNTYNRMKLLGHVLCNNLALTAGHHTAFISISRDELDEYGYQPGDTEGFVNYPLGIEGVDISALFTEKEKDKFVKISLRSRGNIPVNQYSEEFFSGGGHPNAAGGEWYGSLKEAIDHFKATLPGFVSRFLNNEQVVRTSG
ncbi:MAG: DHH family phosphoesterase [Marinilabiliaceae bacterium]